MSEWHEAAMTINGVPLTEGQALTVRVALESLAAELVSTEAALGDDEHGRRMTAAYLARIAELRKLQARRAA